MLEVINGSLMIYFIILSTLSATASFLVKPICQCWIKPSKNERSLYDEMMLLKGQQSQISIKEEFAAYSKIQRRINKLENQLKEDSNSRLGKSIAIKGSVSVILQVFIGLLLFASVIWFRREPIVVLRGNLFPLSSFLSYPSSAANAISTHVFVVISNVSIRTLLKPILS